MDNVGKLLDGILEESTPSQPAWNIEAKLESKPSSWSYIDGCMAMAVLKMYEATNNQYYFDFLDSFIDYYIADDGTIRGYRLTDYNCDFINEGKVLFALYKETKKEKYKKALDVLYSQMLLQPRNIQGSFWHKLIYPSQVWLDGLYMVAPFYAEYEICFNQGAQLSDVLRQFQNAYQSMSDPESGLLFHGYDPTRSAFWSDPVTGRSKTAWTRAIGWYAMALVDTAEIILTNSSFEAIELSRQLQDMMTTVLQYRDDESKMFYQVIDQGTRKGNYLETSGSCALAYSMIKGAKLGMLNERFLIEGTRILEAVVKQKLVVNDQGSFILKDICLVAGLGGIAGKGTYKQRDGSYEYYISEPRVNNDAKGVAPLIFAYAELLK
ncbi:glycoside hydrolase family 88/105 protein [Lapidilactobacillus bayanensis]|uniref:glycoside hydrolase family 88/105 protein n=1 Tax=Lapidilactobacillus bayanensis TaxID=2485998 RepID=UPI000F7B490D|nr:glycoside hydrolase family 88 protein [Lapidilactobacillus bayanensis]